MKNNLKSNKIFKELQELNSKVQKKLTKKWNRNLPFQDAIFDRWERAKELKFGKDASIYNSSIVLGKIKVGKSTWIGPYTLLDGSGKITIGSFCSISSGVHIYTHDSVLWALSGGKKKYNYGRVSIGNNCYIGPYVIISKGVKIGKCSVIGANSLVNKDIPPFSIAFGNPAKIQGKIHIDTTGKITFEYFNKI